MDDSLLNLSLCCPHNVEEGENNESIPKVIINYIALPVPHSFRPKYRFKIVVSDVANEVERCIRAFAEQQQAEIVELNIQLDHVHLLVNVPPKVSISNFVGTLKGRTAIRILNKFRNLKNKPYCGNHFWPRGYSVDAVGFDAEMIRKYVKYQDERDSVHEQRRLF